MLVVLVVVGDGCCFVGCARRAWRPKHMRQLTLMRGPGWTWMRCAQRRAAAFHKLPRQVFKTVLGTRPTHSYGRLRRPSFVACDTCGLRVRAWLVVLGTCAVVPCVFHTGAAGIGDLNVLGSIAEQA